jgi:hypothetical protein
MRFFRIFFLVVIFASGLGAQISVVPTVTHLSSPSTPSVGGISLAVTGGTSPYSYTWTPGSIHTKDITNQTFQAYSVTIKDNAAVTKSVTCSIGYKVAWGEHYGTVMKHDTLQNNGTYSWAQAISKSTLLQSTDGWVEYILRDLNQNKQLGFLDSLSLLKAGPTDIDYGFSFDAGTQRLFRIVNGAATLLVSNPPDGSVLRIQRVGNVISLKVNGASSYSVTNATDAAKMWKLKALIYSINNGSLINVGCSFFNQSNLVFPGYGGVGARVTHVLNPFGYDGSVKVTPTLPGTYTYTWQPGSVSSTSLTSKPMGTYTLTMKDSLNNQRKLVYTVGHKAKWEQFYGAQQRHDTLINIGPHGWAQAVSKNVVPGSTDGWFEYVLRDMNNPKQMGFLDSVSATQGILADVDYGFYYEGANQKLSRVVNGATTLIGHPADGAILRVERIGSVINIKVNGVLTYSVVNATAAAKNWKVKALAYISSTIIDLGMSTSACTLTASAGTMQTITCANPTVTLSGSSNGSGVTYLWNPAGPPPSSSSLSVTTPGIYTLQVTDPSNGCFVTTTVSVVQNICATANIINSIGQINLSITGGVPPYNIAWNGVKLPSSTVAYNALLGMGYPAGPDSVILKHQFDSIKQKTVYSDLISGLYPINIYDAHNDSLNVMGVLGVDFDTLVAKGIAVSTTMSHQTVRNSKTYLYGKGINLAVSGSIIAGENLAVMSHVISTLNSSMIEFEVPDTGYVWAGLTLFQEEIPYGVTDLKARACFEITGSAFSVIVNNVSVYSGAFTPGDLFTISNDASTGDLKFYRNNLLVHTAVFSSIAASGDKFLFKTVAGSPNARLRNVIVVGTVYLGGLSGTVNDVMCGNPCSGSIDAVGQGNFITIPDKYELYLNADLIHPIATVNTFSTGNHGLFTNLCAGKYTVKFSYTLLKIRFPGPPIPSPGILTQTFEIAYKPDWTNAVNVSIAADASLTKNGGSTVTWDAGASSENFLKSTDNGWIEWISPSVESINAIGFNDVDQNLDITDIDYANGYFKVNASIFGIWKYFIKTHNSLMINSLFINGYPMHPFVENKKFRLEKQVVGGITTISLFFNNVLADQFTGIIATDYVVDASLKLVLGTINNPRVSFGCGNMVNYAVPKRIQDGGYYALNGSDLKFTLDGEYTYSKLKYKVLDRTQAIVISDLNANLLSNVSLKIGDNRYSLDCTSLQTGYYTLEVSNEKNERLYLRFKK